MAYNTFGAPDDDSDDESRSALVLHALNPATDTQRRRDPWDFCTILFFIIPFIIGCDQAAKGNEEGATFGFGFALMALVAIVGAVIMERRQQQPIPLAPMHADAINDNSDDDSLHVAP